VGKVRKLAWDLTLRSQARLRCVVVCSLPPCLRNLKDLAFLRCHKVQSS
jgi:hypothetical protein